MSSNIEIKKVCEFCGSVFMAKKTTTRYCSHQCNSRAYKANKRGLKVASVEQKTESTIRIKPIEQVRDKEILTISEAAIFIGVSRPTIYKYLYNGELKSVRLGSKTFIRQADILSLFNDIQEYKPRPNIERKPIADFYTVVEISEKYDVQYAWLYRIVKEHNISKISERGKVYYSKQHIDDYFKSKGFGQHDDITEWYTVQEACEAYSMTLAAVYCFTSENNIPKKKKGRTVYYSKKHFDAAKGLIKPDEPTYYTVEEACEKFGITRDALYHYVKYHNIPKVKDGRYVKLSKPDLDRLFQQFTLFD